MSKLARYRLTIWIFVGFFLGIAAGFIIGDPIVPIAIVPTKHTQYAALDGSIVGADGKSGDAVAKALVNAKALLGDAAASDDSKRRKVDEDIVAAGGAKASTDDVMSLG